MTDESKQKRYTWRILAEEYDCDYRTLKQNCKVLMKQLEKLAGGRKNFRNLNPAQVKLIKEHMG